MSNEITDDLLDALKYVESRGNPRAVSPAGAQGPYQFMPGTARQFGINPFDEKQSRGAAKQYLTQLTQQFGTVDDGLLAYNWGPGNVASYKKTGRGVKGQPIPVEAQEYVGRVRSAQGVTTQPVKRPVTDAALLAQLEGGGTPGKAPGRPVTDPALLAQLEGGEPQAPAVKGPPMGSKGDAYALSEDPGYVEQFAGGLKHAWDTAAGALQKGAGALGLPTGESLEPLVEQGKAFVEKTGPASTFGNVVGEVGLTLAPGGAAFKGGRMLTKALGAGENLVGKGAQYIGGGAAAGAVSEAMLDRDPITGALLGGGLGLAVPAAGKALSLGAKELQRLKGGARGQAVENARTILGERLPHALQRLDDTKPFVAGERVTAGLAADATVPELAIWEANARARPTANRFTQADEATANARINALDEVVTPAGERPLDPTTGRKTQSEYEVTRKQTTDPLYQTGEKDLIALPKDIKKLMMDSGIIGQKFNSAMSRFRTEVGAARAEGTRIPPGGRAQQGDPLYQLSNKQLQMFLEELDSIPFNQRDAGVTHIRKLVAKAMEDQSPDWKTAKTMYREMSSPQNRADVASRLKNVMTSPVDDTAQRARLFSEALREQQSMLRKSGTPKMFESIDEVFRPNLTEGQLGPQQLEKIRNIEKSLQRQAKMENIQKTEGIIPKYRNAFEEAVEKTPNVLMRGISTARSIFKSLARRTNAQVEQVMDDAMRDPQLMAKLLRELPPGERDAFLTFLRDNGSKAVPYIIGPATTQLDDN